MVRAPCCDKMGMKKGPWTPEEDQILISYVQKYGHANWRALPKQAGLLRCGKSCRLRWINYLRPDIKRGNFTADEEETIIKLHEMLGNRWSAIAAKLPGRTDNEIKNVWHTHLKKRLKQYQQLPKPDTKRNSTKSHSKSNIIKSHSSSSSSSFSSATSEVVNDTITSTQSDINDDHQTHNETSQPQPQPSSSSSSASSSNEVVSKCTSIVTDAMMIKAENMENWESFPEIDESFWSDAMSSDNSSAAPFSFEGLSSVSASDADVDVEFQSQQQQLLIGSSSHHAIMEPVVDINGSYTQNLVDDDAMEFWYDLFIQAGGEQELMVADQSSS